MATSTIAKGKAGNIRVNTSESVIVSGIEPVLQNSDGNIEESQVSRLIAGTGSSRLPFNVTGIGGNIDIKTGVLKLSDAGLLSSRSEGKGKAGNININADKLELTEAGRVLTTARSTGAAGNITVNAKDKITISGFDSRFSIPESGFFANSNSPETTNAGNIKVDTSELLLNNQGKISTETSSGNGGDITLNVQDVLLMRNQSNISTTAGTNQRSGDGGNITIKDGFLVTVPNENSDITANAFQGSGGKISIASERIFWMQPRNRQQLIELLDSSTELNPSLLATNDITAFSQQNPDLDGLIAIDLLNAIDPSRGLTPLPTALVDPSQLINPSCSLISAKSSSQFVNTGRGGLPQSPNNPLSSHATVIRLAKPIVDKQTHKAQSTISLPDKEELEPIVEAQGWVKLSNGKIRLTVQLASVTSPENFQATTGCYVR